VKVKLYKGSAKIIARNSPYALYSADLSSLTAKPLTRRMRKDSANIMASRRGCSGSLGYDQIHFKRLESIIPASFMKKNPDHNFSHYLFLNTSK